MGILRDYFGHIFQFNEDKDAISLSTDIASIAAVLQSADERDDKRNISLNAATDSDGLFTPQLVKLRNHAVERATEIGLGAIGVASLRTDTLRLINRLDNAVSSANLDLYSDNAGLSAMASICIHDAHADVAAYIANIANAPQAALEIAPALAALRNTNTDAQIETDRMWDMVDFLNHFSRAQIRDNFATLRNDLAAIVDAFDTAALDHLRAQDSASMAVITGAVVKADNAPKAPKP